MNTIKVGNTSDGGFWEAPFCNPRGCWNIRGKGLLKKWECGDTLTELDGSKYETLHQVFFRGAPPEDIVVEKR